MTLEVIRRIFAWCAVMNIGLLVWWFLFFTLAHDWMYRMHKKWFNLSVETFDTMHYAGIATFKLGTLLFCLVPYLAMHIVG